jgi:hypothetical protein
MGGMGTLFADHGPMRARLMNAGILGVGRKQSGHDARRAILRSCKPPDMMIEVIGKISGNSNPRFL